MKRQPRASMAATILALVLAGCTGTAAPTATPAATATASPRAAATASPTTEPTSVPTATPAPGPTLIPYPGPAIPAGTNTIKISAKALAFSTDTLTAPANTPFVISFQNNDAGVAHNVAIREDSSGPLLFNPLPAIVGVSHADYYVSGGLAAGSYRFLCTVHPIMTGTLTIT